MKTVAIWIFWIVVIVAGWRWIGPSVRDFGDRAACTYQNASGECLTQSQYMKMVAHDAAADALSDVLSFCSYSFNRNDRQCAAFQH